jgi:hypothetical protein
MTGHFIGLKPSYLVLLIYISKRALFREMVQRSLIVFPAAFSSRPPTNQNGELCYCNLCALRMVVLLISLQSNLISDN